MKIKSKRGLVMKSITVKWVSEEIFGYKKAMKVIQSDHERFTVGSRFDFGFFSIATDEGYTIISLPMDQVNENQRQNTI